MKTLNVTTKTLATLLISFMVMGCSQSEFASEMAALNEMDGAMSTMSVNSPIVADGISEARVILKLMNKLGKPVVGIAPTITVSGRNNVIVPCCPSDKDGVSVCRFMSTSAEDKEFVINDKASLSSWVKFTPAAPTTSLFGFVSAGDVQRAPSGHKFVTAVGIAESSIEQRDSNGDIRLRNSHLGTIIDPGAI